MHKRPSTSVQNSLLFTESLTVRTDQHNLCSLMRRISFCIITIILITLFSCSVSSEYQTVTLWTDQEGILPFIEEYNNTQLKFKIQVHFHESPIDDLLHSDITPDLILAENLDTPLSAAKLEPLSILFFKDAIKPDQLYPGLRNLYTEINAKTIIPFSFQLPAIIFKKDIIPDNGTEFIDIDELKEKSKELSSKKGNTIQTIGFSPLWSTNFLVSGGTLFECDFHTDNSGTLIYQEEALQLYLDYLKSWISESAFGYKQERYFTGKYLYESAYNLVETGEKSAPRIGFANILSSAIVHIPEQKQEKIDFKWLSRDFKIPVHENILYFGVIKNAANRMGALDFLKWIMTPATQIHIMKHNISRKSGYFGICGGFSTIASVNETAFTELYPFLKGKIPKPDSLIFPKPLPANWQSIKQDIFMNWVLGQIAGDKWTPIPLEQGT